MTEVLITELSRVSGLPSSALRYYERVGLLSPVGRSDGGYRVYDERAVERLAFIGRAKRLGLTLDEIGDLVELWEDGPCAPVQARLTEMVEEKIAGLDVQIRELTRFRAQLGHVQRTLDSVEPADRCGPECACDTAFDDAGATPVTLGRAPAIECTLGADDVPARLQEWQSVFDRVQAREETAQGVMLRLPRDPALLGSVADLAAREVECCAFFTFALVLDSDGASLEVGAPAEARDMLVEFFGSNSG